MAFSDYIHCERCVELHENYLYDKHTLGDHVQRPDLPGYKAIYVGDSDFNDGVGNYLLLCGKHRKEAFRAQLIRAFTAQAWGVAILLAADLDNDPDLDLDNDPDLVTDWLKGWDDGWNCAADAVAEMPTPEQMADMILGTGTNGDKK